MYERFTDSARTVMQLANKEAQRFGHKYIDSGHILLGLAGEGTGPSISVLKSLNIDQGKIRREMEKILKPGPDLRESWKLSAVPRAKKVIEYAIEEARRLDHDYVGTEHLLLGLLREKEGLAAQVLINLGFQLEDVRKKIVLKPGFGAPSSRWNFPAAVIRDLPPEIRHAVEELDARIGRLQVDKETAIAESDFEQAARLRDQADKLYCERDGKLQDWAAKHPIQASWLWSNECAVAALVRRIASEQQWQDLPLLADALEKAGCKDPEILDHCRQPGDHGGCCWVLHLLLGI